MSTYFYVASYKNQISRYSGVVTVTSNPEDYMFLDLVKNEIISQIKESVGLDHIHLKDVKLKNLNKL